MKKSVESWSSNTGFILACVGAAVGLGNIWKFPSMAGAQGGSAFVIIYLLSIFAIAIPIVVAELVLGRMGQSDAVGSVRVIANRYGRGGYTWIIGGIGVLGSFLTFSFYAVIAGWVSAYLMRTVQGGIADVNAASSNGIFNQLLAAPSEMILHQIIFLALIGFILVRGLRGGLERANIILIPALIIMLLAIVGYGVVEGDVKAALIFLFTPDFSKITPEVIQLAVGHGFFSIGVGFAMMITFGAYIHKTIDLGKTAITIGLADTAIAIIAGIGIFSIAFASGLDPATGPGLIFVTLPVAFAQIPGGIIIAFIFFLLVYFAALTSGLALAETIIRWAMNQFNLSRLSATTISLFLTFVVGLLTVFSFNIWSDIQINGRSLFDSKDYLTTAVLLPIGGLLIVLFTCWAIPIKALEKNIATSKPIFKLWLWLSRIAAPLGILWIFWENI